MLDLADDSFTDIIVKAAVHSEITEFPSPDTDI